MSSLDSKLGYTTAEKYRQGSFDKFRAGSLERGTLSSNASSHQSRLSTVSRVSFRDLEPSIEQAYKRQGQKKTKKTKERRTCIVCVVLVILLLAVIALAILVWQLFEDKARTETETSRLKSALSPVDGGFGEWSSYGSCSKTCGNDGTRNRVRGCDSPAPMNDGEDCKGLSLQTIACRNQTGCPVDGGWGVWQVWGICSQSCGTGTRLRSRYCDNPYAANNGNACSGSRDQYEDCNTTPCQISCVWQDWSEWISIGSCSAVCNGGQQDMSRSRAQARIDNQCTQTEQQLNTVECNTGQCRAAVCDFSDSSYCGYTNDNSTGFTWRLNSGPTSTAYTGPDYDHTNGSGKYIYLEASATGIILDDTVRIATPMFESNGQACLIFWYHMKGYYMGALNVYVKNASSSAFTLGDKVWSTFGHRGFLWNMAYIPVNLPAFRVVFEGVRGTTINSDVAIDDVSITEGPCDIPTSVQCDFEEPFLCGYSQSQSDGLEWTWEMANTPSSNTGCPADHTFKNGSGHYLYIEASLVEDGKIATLLSPALMINEGEGSQCLTFWYHMYGDNIGSLEVTAKGTDDMNGIFATWNKTNTQANQWILGNMTINTFGSVTFEFSAKRGVGGSKGDICLDDIDLSPGQC